MIGQPPVMFGANQSNVIEVRVILVQYGAANSLGATQIVKNEGVDGKDNPL